MRNRSAILAATAAAIAMGSLGGVDVQNDRQMRAEQFRTGSQSSVPGGPVRTGFLGSLMDAMGSLYGGFGGRTRYRKRNGWTCAEGKRRARKARNRRRAKGQFRKAVR